VALLSLPRDLIVPIPGYGQARINATTVYGDMNPALGGGVALARRTVSEYLGIPIDYVLRTDFHAFTAAVDAIGGVDIDVPEALYDPEYPTMDYGYMVASFAPGVQHMDGETTLVYARIRHADSGYARNRRQQQVLLAILNQVRQHNILAQVQMISDLTTALRDDIQTDMSLERMLGLAWAFRGVSPNAVERYALDETMVSEGVLSDDPYATFADQGAVDMLVRQLVNGPVTAP
jgi:LCP family protein required for cell wall assembly